MRQSILLTILLGSLLGCQSLPPPPKGEIYVMDISNNVAQCVPIEPSLVDQLYFVKGGCPAIPISKMDNFLAISPDTWQSIQGYIVKLKNLASQRCE